MPRRRNLTAFGDFGVLSNKTPDKFSLRGMLRNNMAKATKTARLKRPWWWILAGARSSLQERTQEIIIELSLVYRLQKPNLGF